MDSLTLCVGTRESIKSGLWLGRPLAYMFLFRNMQNAHGQRHAHAYASVPSTGAGGDRELEREIAVGHLHWATYAGLD